MLIDLKKLIQLYDFASVGGLIDPAVIKFREGSIVADNISPSYSLLSVVRSPPSLAKEYEPLGTIVLTEKLVKSIKKMFKADDYVKLSVDKDDIVIEGSSEKFTFKNMVPTTEVPEFGLVQTDYGLVLKKPKIVGAFKVDFSELHGIADEDTITLKVSDRKLIVSTGIEGGKYEKALKLFDVREASQDITQTFNGDELAEVVELIGGVGWIVMTEDPLIITAEVTILPANVMFALAPRVVT